MDAVMLVLWVLLWFFAGYGLGSFFEDHWGK